MVKQRSSTVLAPTDTDMVRPKRSGLASQVLIACGLTVAALSVGAPAHASHGAKGAKSHHSQAAEDAPAGHNVSGPKANPDKKEAREARKAAREKRKAERAARREEKLAKAKAKKKDAEKVAKADKPMNDDMGGSDDPLEGL